MSLDPTRLSTAAEPEKTSISELLSTWGHNFTHNTTAALNDMGPRDYIRLIIIIGAYCLLRPQIIKLGARLQTKQHERDALDDGAEIHPNELRGKFEIPGVDPDSDEEDLEEDEGRTGDWGRKARVRQRKFIREALEREEKRLADEQEDESDKDIEEFLTG